MHFVLGEFRQGFLDIINIRAFFADHNTRTSRVDGDVGFLGRTLDDDLADTGCIKYLFQVRCDFEIFVQLVSIFRAGIPT